MAKVIIDAGHGGMEPGAIYEGRQEKDDTLRLALAVGEILERNGVQVAFTRTEDVYNTPFEKAQIANEEGGDFLISIHRNSSPEPNQYSGVESLIYNRQGEKVQLAENINSALERAGFRNLGVKERPNLVILRRTRMPAVLVETGFLNTDADNELFDENFDAIAQAIADGVLKTLRENQNVRSGNMQEIRSTAEERPAGGGMSGGTMSGGTMSGGGMSGGTMSGGGMSGGGMSGGAMPGQTRMDAAMPQTAQRERLYRVQTGAFRNQTYAEELLYQLQQQSFPAFILYEDHLFKVQVGAFRQLDNAVRMEDALRRQGYSTYITT